MADEDKQTQNISYKCHVCDRSQNLKRCARCKNVLYCSREHQIADWNVHKQICNGDKREKETFAINDRIKHAGSSSVVQENEEWVEFDTRRFQQITFQAPKSYNFRDIAHFVHRMLQRNGYCVVDSVFKSSHLDDVLKEVNKLEFSGQLQTGKLAGGRTSGVNHEKVVNSNIRNDKLKWLEGNEKEYPNICKVLQTMDTIVSHLNLLLNPKHNIHRRTKVSL